MTCPTDSAPLLAGEATVASQPKRLKVAFHQPRSASSTALKLTTTGVSVFGQFTERSLLPCF